MTWNRTGDCGSNCRAIAHSQVTEDRRHMYFDRSLSDVESRRYFLVWFPLNQKFENIQLTRSQRASRVGVRESAQFRERDNRIWNLRLNLG